MTTDELNLISAEYTKSMELQGVRHTLWRNIMRHYRLESIESLLVKSKDLPLASLEALDVSVPNINVLVRKLVTLTALRNPDFLIKSENPRNEPIAELIEASFRDIRGKIDWTPTMGKILMSGAFSGLCVAKIGLRSKFIYNETAWTEDSPDKRSAKDAYDEYGLPYGPTTEYTGVLVEQDMPVLTWVEPWNICFNLGARTDKDIRRIYHRVRRPLIDVKHDSRYDRSARRDVEGQIDDDDDFYLTEEDGYPEGVLFVDVIEVFDKASRQYAVFVEGVDKPLRDWTPYPYQADPYIFFNPIEDLEAIWGIPYALLLLNAAEAVNVLRKLIVEQIGSDGKRVILFDEDVMPGDKVDEVNKAVDGQWVGVKGLNDREKPPFQVVDFGGANPNMLKLSSLFESDLAFASGLTEATRNSLSGVEQTATEVQLRQQQEGLSVEDIRVRFEAFQEKCAAGICKIMLQEWPAERHVKVQGANPEIYFWTTLERQRVLSNFSLEIVAGSTEKVDKAVYRRQWLDLLPRIGEIGQQIAQEQQTGVPSEIDWMEVLRVTLDQFDPTVASKILRRHDPVDLLMQLLQQFKMHPEMMSPKMQQQVEARILQTRQMGLPQQQQGPQQQQPNVVPFEQRQGVPSPQQVTPQGNIQQQMPGYQSGRAMSERGGVGV